MSAAPWAYEFIESLPSGFVGLHFKSNTESNEPLSIIITEDDAHLLLSDLKVLLEKGG